MSDPAWTLEFYEEHGREPALDFLRGLDDFKEQALAAALRNVLAYEGLTRWKAKQRTIAKQAGGRDRFRGQRRS